MVDKFRLGLCFSSMLQAPPPAPSPFRPLPQRLRPRAGACKAEGGVLALRAPGTRRRSTQRVLSGGNLEAVSRLQRLPVRMRRGARLCSCQSPAWRWG